MVEEEHLKKYGAVRERGRDENISRRPNRLAETAVGAGDLGLSERKKKYTSIRAEKVLQIYA